jgi:uncharacterized protein
VAEEPIQIETPKGPVSALWGGPEGARAVLVIAHGAGGTMRTGLLDGFCSGLDQAGFDTLRFNFPFSEQGRKSPDRPDVLMATIRAAVETARERDPNRPVFAGGKSMGGRMASMAVAEGMRVNGLIFIGYPLHPPGHPEKIRDEHLYGIRVPMLFLQGTDDPFAQWELVQGVVDKLGTWAQLHRVEGGDHSFRVRGSRKPDDETGRLLGSVAARFVQGAQI